MLVSYITKCDLCGKEKQVSKSELCMPEANLANSQEPKYLISKIENNIYTTIELCEDCEKKLEKKLDEFFASEGNILGKENHDTKS